MRRRRPDRLELYESATYVALQEALAANVRRARASLGLTQEAAAHACGMSARLLQRVEAADVNPTLITLARLSGGLGLDATALLQRSATPADDPAVP